MQRIFENYSVTGLTSQREHSPSHANIFKYEECDHTFTLRYSLRQHMNDDHVQQNVVKCEICQFRASRTFDLKKTHKRVT